MRDALRLTSSYGRLSLDECLTTAANGCGKDGEAVRAGESDPW
jgi:hypothetical protein